MAGLCLHPEQNLPLLAKGRDSMVKRDRLLVFMRGLAKLAAILFFLIPLVFFWGYVFERWPIGPKDILQIAFAILAPLAGIAFWKDETVKRKKRIEALRISAHEAPIVELNAEVYVETPPLPIILTLRMSTSWYVGFPIAWLLLFGILFLFIHTDLDTQDTLLLCAGWLVIGGATLGLTGITEYQRIKVTEQALIIQKGIIRRKVKWEQALLFAFMAENKQYELSDEHTILRWYRSHPGSGFTARPAEKQVYEHSIDTMLVYIQHRTNLPLRDLR